MEPDEVVQRPRNFDIVGSFGAVCPNKHEISNIVGSFGAVRPNKHEISNIVGSFGAVRLNKHEISNIVGPCGAVRPNKHEISNTMLLRPASTPRPTLALISRKCRAHHSNYQLLKH